LLKERYRKSEKIQSIILFIIISIIWGSSFILIKKGLNVFTPIQVGTIRIMFAFLFMLPVAIKNIRKVPKDKIKFFVITGTLGNLIPAVLFAMAETKLESSVAGILNALTPLFTLLIAVFIYKLKVKGIQIFGLIIGLAGTIAFSLVNNNGALGSINIYVWYIVIATIFYATNLNLIKEYFSNIRSIIVTALSMFFIGPVCIIYLFTTDFIFKLSSVSGAFESMGYLAILGVFGTAIALILYTRLIQINSAVVASSVAYLIPIVAIFWGILDNEVLYPLHFAGMILILSGIYFANKT